MKKRSKIIAVNYANERYRRAQQVNAFAAKFIGKADAVKAYSPSDIPDAFRDKHRGVFSNKRGDGLWLWKPYLVLKALRELDDGDVIFYSDSGSFCIRSLNHLINAMDRGGKDMIFFELPLLARSFTKSESVYITSVDLGMHRQVAATYFLARKSPETISFFEKWLSLCEDERLLSPDIFMPEIIEDSCFIAHREDQSVLTILCIKEGIESFRDPSDYGVFPWQYVVPGFAYSEGNYTNSDYPVVILSNRSRSAMKYFFAYVAKCLLLKLGLGGFLKRRYVKS